MAVGRVRDRRTFEALRRSRARGRSGPVTVITVQEPTASEARVAFAIGTNVGGAVVRNRLRRRLRAAAAELALPPGAYLLRVGPDARSLPAAALRAHFEQAARAALEATP